MGDQQLALESLKAPYLLRLRQSGPKLLCHQGGPNSHGMVHGQISSGCNAVCDGGHVMKAQYCGGVLCPKGHTLMLGHFGTRTRIVVLLNMGMFGCQKKLYTDDQHVLRMVTPQLFRHLVQPVQPV